MNNNTHLNIQAQKHMGPVRFGFYLGFLDFQIPNPLNTRSFALLVSVVSENWFLLPSQFLSMETEF